MESRAAALIHELRLAPHPEGGWYRETFRSPRTVLVNDVSRSAITTILYLLARAELSRWHRVAQDELWHFLDGDALELLVLADGRGSRERYELARAGDGGEPLAVVPAGHWQAARATGDWSLVSCTMGPGFEFEEFTLLRDDARAPEILAAMPADWRELL